MTKSQRGKKIYYLPGLISLIFLPILCYQFNFYKIPKEQRMLEVTMWNPRDTLEYPQFGNPLKFVNDKFVKIKLNGEASDKTKLKFTQLVIRDLIKQNASTEGIEVIFDQKANYSSLVELYNLCEIEGPLMYCYFENKFWVFKHPITKGMASLTPICGISAFQPNEFTTTRKDSDLFKFFVVNKIMALVSSALFLVLSFLVIRGAKN
jgi:hypothetical protein